jgi:hypothetical protein
MRTHTHMPFSPLTQSQLTPHIFTRADIVRVFKASNSGVHADDDASSLCFPEFVECIARCGR